VNVLARVAGFYEKRDGYQRNLFNNTRAGNVDRYGLRGSLTFKLSDTIKERNWWSITCIRAATA